MAKLLDPFRLLVICLAGRLSQRHLQAIDYLREENRVLREQVGDRRLRLVDTSISPLTAVQLCGFPSHLPIRPQRGSHGTAIGIKLVRPR
jgi:hypothetical protein